MKTTSTITALYERLSRDDELSGEHGVEPYHVLHHRRLSAARPAEENEYLPAPHLERDVVQYHRAGISGVNVFEFYYWIGHGE